MHFSETSDFVTVQTCTHQLQTFRHIKKHTGSPAKDESSTLRVNNHVDYDPRPLEFVNQAGYSDYFRNTCTKRPLVICYCKPIRIANGSLV